MTRSHKYPEHPWFKLRNYAHFDKDLGISALAKLVQSDALVAAHSFLPFLSDRVLERRYKPLLNKTVDKTRPIMIPSHVDAHIFSYYASTLGQAHDQRLIDLGCSESVLAYRRWEGGKCNIHFAVEAFDEVRKMANGVAIAIDLEAFFDSIPHALIKNEWKQTLQSDRLPDGHYAVFRSMTRYAHASRAQVCAKLGISYRSIHKRREALCTPEQFRAHVRGGKLIQVNKQPNGIPQGSPISGLIANLAMTSFDAHMHSFARARGGSYRRYSDDILLLAPTTEIDDILDELSRRIDRSGLRINNDKTERTVFRTTLQGQIETDRPLQYLGLLLDGDRILLRSRTLSRYWRRVKSAIHNAEKAARASHRRGGNRRLFRRTIFLRFTHLGSRNFIEYAGRCSSLSGSEPLAGQTRAHWAKIARMLDRADNSDGPARDSHPPNH